MPDNTNIRQPEDPTKINIRQPWEIAYWTKEFNVSKEKLIRTVKKVGPLVKNVKKELDIN